MLQLVRRPSRSQRNTFHPNACSKVMDFSHVYHTRTPTFIQEEIAMVENHAHHDKDVDSNAQVIGEIMD